VSLTSPPLGGGEVRDTGDGTQPPPPQAGMGTGTACGFTTHVRRDAAVCDIGAGAVWGRAGDRHRSSWLGYALSEGLDLCRWPRMVGGVAYILG
jgi:hypothetical protein